MARNVTIATVTFNTPDTRNALTVDMGRAFKKVMEELRDDSTVKAVVLTGNGQAFSAGGDMKFLTARLTDTAEGNVKAMLEFYNFFLSLRTLPVPVVAALNGHAIGAGFCVALGCDIRIAAAGAKLSVNFTRLGIHPGMGATFFLPRLIGYSNASRLLLTGEQITAEDAHRMGIVSAVVPSDKVLGEGIRVAHEIATASSVATQQLLQTLRTDDRGDARGTLQSALQREANAQAVCYAEGKDLQEALNAMKEKRTPKFF